MPFVTQIQVGGECCGAMCYCYLQWLLDGRNPDDEDQDLAADAYEAQRVYRYVQFGDAKPLQIPKDELPPEYCDPVKIVSLLNVDPIREGAFYISPKSSLMKILGAMQAPYAVEEYFIEKMERQGMLKNEDLPELKDGEYAIALYDVLYRGQNFGKHYILFEKKWNQLRRLNPWDGCLTACSSYDSFQAQGKQMEFAHAGILFRPLPKP